MESAAAPLTIEIAPPDKAARAFIGGQGHFESRSYQTFAWQPPEGTERKQIGIGLFVTIWRITLPDQRSIIEMHVPSTGLSVLFDSAQYGPDLLVE